MHTHRSLVSSGLHFMATWPFDRQTRWLVASPMFHTGGVTRHAGHRLGRRHPRHHAQVRPRPGARPHRARGGHAHAARAHHAGRGRRRPARPAAERQLAAVPEPRRVAHFRRDAQADPPGLPRRRAAARVRHHRDDTDHHAAAARGAHPRHPADPLVRPARRGRRGAGRRRSPGRRAAGRGGRDRRAQPQRDGRLLAEAGADRRGHARRLVPDRRPRVPGRGLLHLPGRPGQGHDRQRRREHLLDRGGGRAGRPSRRSRRSPSSAFPTRAGARRSTRSCSAGWT